MPILCPDATGRRRWARCYLGSTLSTEGLIQSRYRNQVEGTFEVALRMPSTCQWSTAERTENIVMIKKKLWAHYPLLEQLALPCVACLPPLRKRPDCDPERVFLWVPKLRLKHPPVARIVRTRINNLMRAIYCIHNSSEIPTIRQYKWKKTRPQQCRAIGATRKRGLSKSGKRAKYKSRVWLNISNQTAVIKSMWNVK